jgi:hypothetical protein
MENNIPPMPAKRALAVLDQPVPTDIGPPKRISKKVRAAIDAMVSGDCKRICDATAATGRWLPGHQYQEHVVAALAGLAEPGEPVLGAVQQLRRIRSGAEPADRKKGRRLVRAQRRSPARGFRRKVRAHVAAPLTASLAGEARFDAGKPDIIRPLISADGCRVAAFIIGAVDQDAVDADSRISPKVIFCCWWAVSGIPHDSADHASREAARDGG